MMNNIMGFDEFWGWFIVSTTDIDDENKCMDLKRIGDLEKKLDSFYQHLELEIDEKSKHKSKKSIKLDQPTKNHLDNLVANYELEKKKREYLSNQMKTASTGGGEYTA